MKELKIDEVWVENIGEGKRKLAEKRPLAKFGYLGIKFILF